MNTFRFSLNRIISPSLPLTQFIQLANEVGASGIELRNDLNQTTLTDGLSLEAVRDLCEKALLSIDTINALQRFNDETPRVEELELLLKDAEVLGCKAIVLCPVNGMAKEGERGRYLDQTIHALSTYASLFKQSKIMGYVEPLGFKQSSLRLKADAWQAITESGHSHWYKLVHDTFHHHLSEESSYFPQETGLVHISGVHPGKAKDTLNDEDRVLVHADDQLETKTQLTQLLDGGFDGIISFEPFSYSVQHLGRAQLYTSIKRSIAFLSS